MSHRYEKVSFIKLGRRKGNGCWLVEPPSDYGEGWHFGEYRALELLQWVKRGAIDDLGFVLNHIADDQQKYRHSGSDQLAGHRGAILGFWRVIGWFATARAEGVDFDATAKAFGERHAESARAWAAQVEKWKKEKSERGRRAASARWAKKAA